MSDVSVLRPKGHIWLYGEGKTLEFDTLQCVHCGMHWTVQPGSGRVRGFCMQCNGPHCGQPKCMTCVPMEQQLDNMERGKPVFHKPIFAPVLIDLKG